MTTTRGPQPQPQPQPILVVDFGTSTSAAALVTPDGQVRLVEEPTGQSRHWPSEVFLDGETLLVGSPAHERRSDDPLAYRAEFKPLLGAADSVPLGGKSFRPEELVAELLHDIREQAEHMLGSTLARVVLTVPASYTAADPRPELMIAAAELAGFTEVELLAEPVAAALTPLAGAPFTPDDLVLVYDFGGGTFDAAVVRVTADGHEVLGHDALDGCGGRDIDSALYEHLRVLGGDALDALLQLPDDGDEEALRELSHLQVELREVARRVKHKLTDTPTASARFFPARLNATFDRDTLAGIARPLLARTIDCCRQVLTRAEITARDLTAVLLVGGSTRMPIVVDTVTRELGHQPRTAEYPVTAVVQGAARWARSAESRACGPLDLRENEHPLRWPLPGGSATLVRWLVEPGERYEPRAPLALVRLPDGALWQLRAGGRSGMVNAVHASPGSTVTADDWLATIVSGDAVAAPVRAAGPRIHPATPMAVLPLPDGRGGGAAWGPDRSLVAGSGQVARLLVPEGSGWTVRTEFIHTGRLTFARPTADGRRLVTLTGENVQVWSVRSGNRLATIKAPTSLRPPALSTDGARIAVASPSGIGMWDLATAAQLTPPLKGLITNGVAFSPDNRSIAVSAVNPQTVRFIPLGGGQDHRVFKFDAVPEAVTFSVGGNCLLVSFEGLARTVPLLDTHPSLTLEHGTEGMVEDVAGSPNGRWWATASVDGTARVWDAVSGAELLRVEHDAQVRTVAFSLDGALLASSDEEAVRITDLSVLTQD